MIKDGYCFCSNEWALDTSIKSELGLLLIISSYTAENGYCFASNKHFADLFSVDEVSISRKIKKLADKNYIELEYIKRGAEVIERRIRLTKMLIDGLQKRQPTVSKNVKDNNTSINNKENLIKENNEERQKYLLAQQKKEEERERLAKAAELTKQRLKEAANAKYGVK